MCVRVTAYAIEIPNNTSVITSKNKNLRSMQEQKSVSHLNGFGITHASCALIITVRVSVDAYCFCSGRPHKSIHSSADCCLAPSDNSLKVRLMNYLLLLIGFKYILSVHRFTAFVKKKFAALKRKNANNL